MRDEREDVMTAFGPAKATVDSDGKLHLSWEGPFSLNRVPYLRGSVYESSYLDVYLTRADGGAPTSGAQEAARREHRRLKRELVTRERVLKARVRSAESEVRSCEDKVEEAQAGLLAALARLEELSCELSGHPAQDGRAA